MATGPVTYQVTTVNDDTTFPLTGSPVPGKRVSFTVSNGYGGSVFVPDSTFNDLSVIKGLIEEQVRNSVAALTLTGSV